MNRGSYNRIAAQWDLARRDFIPREREHLDAFTAGFPAGAMILDAGCGTGRPMAEYLIGRGFRVLGVDQAEELLALAQARFPDQSWVRASLEEYPFETPFQGALCWDSLFHIERGEQAKILARIVHRVPAGGRLMLTAGGSANPAFTDTMFGEEFFYDSHPPERLREILEGLGMTILVGEFMERPTGGRNKGRYAIVAQKE